MKMAILILPALFFFLPVSAQVSDDRMIIDAMNEQKAAWNAGDMVRYMETYWKNDSLVFIGKSGPYYGWQNTLDNYKKSYPDTASMGRLSFEIVSVKRLSVLYYNVIGKWYLQRTKGNLNGAFTLLFKKIKGRWVIVQDHSS